MFVFCTQGQEGRDQIRYESLVHFQLEIGQDKDTEKREREREEWVSAGRGPKLAACFDVGSQALPSLKCLVDSQSTSRCSAVQGTFSQSMVPNAITLNAVMTACQRGREGSAALRVSSSMLKAEKNLSFGPQDDDCN